MYPSAQDQSLHPSLHTFATSSFDYLTHTASDLLVFGYLPWNENTLRTQELLRCFSKQRRVFYFEEPMIETLPHAEPRIETMSIGVHLTVAVPYLPSGLSPEESDYELRKLVNQLIDYEEIDQFTAWYFAPRALAYSDHLQPETTVYDCFLTCEPGLERELLQAADLVFTDTPTLFAEKKQRHFNVHCLQSTKLRSETLAQKMLALECETRVQKLLTYEESYPRRLLA